MDIFLKIVEIHLKSKFNSQNTIVLIKSKKVFHR